MKIEELVERIQDKDISTLINMTLIVYKNNPRAKGIIETLNRGIERLEKSGRLKVLQTLYLTNSNGNKGE